MQRLCVFPARKYVLKDKRKNSKQRSRAFELCGASDKANNIVFVFTLFFGNNCEKVVKFPMIDIHFCMKNPCQSRS